MSWSLYKRNNDDGGIFDFSGEKLEPLKFSNKNQHYFHHGIQCLCLIVMFHHQPVVHLHFQQVLDVFVLQNNKEILYGVLKEHLTRTLLVTVFMI